MAAGPSLPAINALITPPSDAESLALYTPSDPISILINNTILSHPLARRLRANPDFSEARPHLKIPEAARAHNLTSGTLSGPGRLWVPPLAFSEKGGKSLVVIFYVGTDLCGYPGVIHGGFAATMLDEGMARCCFPALPNKVGMTANLKIDYEAPLPAESYVVLRAETTKVEGRKAWVRGSLGELTANGEEGKVFVEAEALFVEPKRAKVSHLRVGVDGPIRREKDGIHSFGKMLIMTFYRPWGYCSRLSARIERI